MNSADILDAADASTSGRDNASSSLIADAVILRVLSGVQQGAEATLPALIPQTLGSGPDNDIVLRDASIEELHVRLRVDQQGVHIDCINGSILIDGMDFHAGDSACIQHIGLVQVGEVGLLLETGGVHGASPAASAAYQAEITHAVIPDSSDVADELPVSVSQAAADDGLTKNSASRFGFKSGLAMLASMVASMVIGTWIVWQSGLFQQPSKAPVTLSNFLSASPFSALNIEQSGNQAWVSGFLDTREQSRELNQWLLQSGLQVNNEVVVGEVLTDQVLDVFRVHGVDGQGSAFPNGDVAVTTRVADTSLLEIINKRVLADIPGINSLEIDNTPPPVVTETKPLLLDAGKRVAMIVSDAPAYIVTEDKSRYFVGSWLPTGHQIESIIDGQVMLDKDGEKTLLEF